MPDEVVVDDRRAAIEAAFEQEEKAAAESAPLAAETPPPPAPPVDAPSPPAEHTEAPAPTSAPAPLPAQAKAGVPPAPPPTEFDVEKAPQSWRAPQREKWSKLDPDIRQEVMRRERETLKVLGDSATARGFQTQFNETIQPYRARLESLGVDPIRAVHELLRTDWVLSSAPKVQRAQAMAKIITDYDIDIVELDAALAGKTAADPVDARVEQLLMQRLAPFQQYIQTQQQREAEQERRTDETINSSIANMQADPKFPHFQELREDMADVIEIAAKRGVYLSLADAYTRAVAMNPTVSAQVATQQSAEARKQAAEEANRKAQRALGASVSVGGAPGGVPSGASGATDRRSVIAAAFDAAGGGR